MTRRELEQWVAANRERLANRDMSVLFAFGPSIDPKGSESWVSFISRRGTGRLIRAADGSSRMDVYSFGDGSRLREERGHVTLVGQLERIVDLLSFQAAAR